MNLSRSILGAVSIFVIASILLMGTVTASQFVFADGGINSPAICEGGPTDNTGGPTTINSASNIASICIKDGSGSFAQPFPQHSGLIVADGTYGLNNCYTVTGIGTMQVMITENCQGMAISHIDYFLQGGVPPGGFQVGGEFIGIDSTAILLAGVHTASAWMIPAIIAAVGIGIVFARKF